MATTLEDKIHGGFLHLANDELAARLNQQTPSLYDCLLGSIYLRKLGLQKQALDLLDIHANSDVFEATYNRVQSSCHMLDFATARQICLEAKEAYSQNWNDSHRGYIDDALRVTNALVEYQSLPNHHCPNTQKCSYISLDAQERTASAGLVGHDPRVARTINATFRPSSQCWVDVESGEVAKELLQPNHDFRSFYGNPKPWLASSPERSDTSKDEVDGTTVYVESNPHFGHFVTQSASFANAIHYAQELTRSRRANAITVLSRGEIPLWAQGLLQAGCEAELRFKILDGNTELNAKELVVCPPTWIEWHYSHIDHKRPFQRASKRWIGSLLNENASLGREKSRMLYFSRSRLEGGLRQSTNEHELEEQLCKLGFHIVHPQELPIQDVARLVNEATIIAGPMGSAMHNVLFSLEPQSLKVLNFAHYLPGINGTLVEQSCGIVNNFYVRSCEEQASEGGLASKLHFNVDRCMEATAAVLDQPRI